MGKRTTDDSLLARTHALLLQARKQGVTYLTIHVQTGLRPNWLSSLANERIPNPSVTRVQRLHDYLAALRG